MSRFNISVFCAAALLLSGCSSVTSRLLADDPLARSEAIEAAAKSSARSKQKLVARLARILKKKDPVDRVRAAAALEDLGPAAASAIPDLIAVLGDPDTDIADSADRALRKLDGSAPALAAALATTDPALRSRIGRVLTAQGPAAIPALVKNFGQGKRELALWSAGILGQMGPAAESAVPALARAAASNDAAVAGQAATALSAVGSPAGLWLGAALSSSNPAARSGASKVLALMAPPPAEAAEALIGALEDPDAKVREHAAAALSSYPPAAYASLPKSLTPALVKLSSGTDAAAGLAKTALERSGYTAAVLNAKMKSLSAALKSADQEARIAAAEALGNTGPAASEAMPELWTLFRSRDCRERASAARALSRISPRLLRNGAVTRALIKVCPSRKVPKAGLPGPAPRALTKGATAQPQAPR